MDRDIAHSDILTLLRRSAGERGTAPAILDSASGALISYNDLLSGTERLAAVLRGIGAKRIALILPNGSDMSCALIASAVAGTALPFNPVYTEAEFDAYFGETECDILVTRSGMYPAAERAAARANLPIHALDDLLAKAASATTGDLTPPAPEDVAMVLLTSGSTGRAKRVPLSHRNVCTGARDVARSVLLAPEDRCLSMWELFHVGGLVDLLMAPLHSGGTVIATPGFEAARFFNLLRDYGPTWFQAVPTALGELVLHANRPDETAKGSSLRLIRSVAAALSPTLFEQLESTFGVPVLQTFGMTEAAPLITSTRLDAVRIKGSVGPSCGTEVAIFDGIWSRLPASQEGEVAVRGPNVFAGYEADPAANEAAFKDGWFRTGDLGKLDEGGNLFLTGRIKELVNRGGEKVNLREVDDAILAIAGVYEAACFPVPHPTLGEDVAAAVVLQPGSSLTAPAIREALAGRLAPFKIPRRILVTDALPRNAVGKIDRRALADQAERRAAADATNSGGELSETEARIAAIWSREMNVPKVGPTQDFVLLGGDSLAGLRVLLAVEEAFGKTLPDDTLTSLSTVRDLARVLEDAPAYSAKFDHGNHMPDRDYRTVLAIMATGRIPALEEGSMLKVANRDGTRTPLLWFFNSPGIELMMLAQFLPSDIPLYAGYSGGKVFERSDETLMLLARCYVEELKVRFPDGNLIIGGNCQGGRVGWMVTKLLAEAGIVVKQMVYLEFSHPDLTAFDGEMLLMFGRQSARKSYRHIKWGRAGWDEAFKVKPIVCWIDGTHGGFFREDTIRSYLATMLAFFDGRPILDTTLKNRATRITLFLHKIPVVFEFYRQAYKLKARWKYGKRVEFNPFSGEVVKRGGQAGEDMRRIARKVRT